MSNVCVGVCVWGEFNTQNMSGSGGGNLINVQIKQLGLKR